MSEKQKLAIIISDQKDVGSCLSFQLEQYYEVKIYMTTETAEKDLYKGDIKPDIIIMDIFIERETCIEICNRIRLKLDKNEYPIMVITWGFNIDGSIETNKDTINKILDAGANNVLHQRPFDHEDLLECVFITINNAQK